MSVPRPLYIERNEGVGSIVTRLESTGDKDVGLVFPPRSELFNNVVEVKFLKREVDKLDKDIVVITQDEEQKKMAEGVGLKVKEELKDETEDQFLESFYEQGEKKEASEEKQTSKQQEDSSQSSRLQVSDIVSPSGKEEKPESKNKAKNEEEVKEKKQALKKKKTPRNSESVSQPASSDQGGLKLDASSVGWWDRIKPYGSLPRFLGWLLVVSLVTLVLTVTFVFPQATAIVHPVKEQGSVAFPLSINTEIASPDFENNVVPGEIFTLNNKVSREFAASGTKEVEKKATGTVKIYNAYSSEPQVLVETTRFVSESGKLFRIPKTVKVPAADVENGEIKPNYIKVKVVADEPGKEYNIGPSRFTIPGFKGSPKYDGFYAISEKPMKGGKVGKVSVVTKEDKEQAAKELKKELLDKTKSSLKEKIAQDLTLVNESLQAKVESTKVDAQTENFQVTLEGKAQAFAFRYDYVKKIIKNKLREQISKDQKILEDTLSVSYKKSELDFKKGKAKLEVTGKAKIAWQIDRSKLKKVLAGKNRVETRKATSEFPEIKDLKVQWWPFWLNSFPNQEKKIEVKLSY